uniref:DNA-directed RNA polymerase subunit n=1 Tax=Monomastix sp. (strain OKE-1) TaxID=141716 RepID=C0JWJ6_MONSK|nr:beta' subunit of RNA polymerase [Monomastix sp. OKE-1]ACK36865.1 beta' subunit of RNA polymerase [Monomastix sp. OKE-1]
MKTFMQIGLASSEEIQSWAERSLWLDGNEIKIGEVKKADTINYRSFKPEKDGLFCERIFGPVKDWVCACGQSKLKVGKGQNPRATANLSKNTGTEFFPRDPLFSPVVRAKGLEGFPSRVAGEGELISPFGFRQSENSLLNSGLPNLSVDKSNWAPQSPTGQEAQRPQVGGLFIEGATKESTKKSDENPNSSPQFSNREKFQSVGLGPYICPNCQVEVTLSRVRRYRMGYIELGCPVTHIWYLNSRPNIFSVLLKIPTKYVKKITYYRGYSPAQKEFELSQEREEQDLPLLSKMGRNKPSTYTEKFPHRLETKLQKELFVFGVGNPCVGPGGDFFDNEWEFLHVWFSLPRSSKPLPKGQTFPRDPLEDRRSPPIRGEAFGPHNAKKERAKGLEGEGLWPFGPTSFESGLILQNHKLGANTTDTLELNFKSEKKTLRGGTKFTELSSSKLQKSVKNVSWFSEKQALDSIAQKDQNIVPINPSWLENTGARAFKEHFKTRNWKKEFEKLQDDLRRTPVFFSESIKETKTEFAEEGSYHVSGTESFSNENIWSLTPSFSMYENLLKRRKKRVRTLKLLNLLRTAGGAQSFDGFIFTTLPVLPPELRPIVQLSAGQFASSDVNDLYRRLISRNNRLKYYFTACGPHLVEFLVRSEQHLVQVAVDSLLDGSSAASEIGSLRRMSNSGSGGGNKPLTKGSNLPVYKSLSDRIGGKQGRFRQNLLGKRVDYSGRSVIVVGPRLKLHECGLPYEMALELFQAFVIRHILELQLAKTIRGAKNLLKLNKPFARQILQNVVQSHPILLNRAPTLHRLGIQAFQPKLIYGRAIQLHPLVCSAFNADFDGDQMAVHVPLSPKARVEARLLMLATTNWLSAATGQPSVLPSQDMVLGFYYLTTLQPKTQIEFNLSLNERGGVNIPEGERSSQNFVPWKKSRPAAVNEIGDQNNERRQKQKKVDDKNSLLFHFIEIVENGPSQRNGLDLHQPLWLQKTNLWPGEKRNLWAGKQSIVQIANQNKSGGTPFPRDPRGEPFEAFGPHNGRKERVAEEELRSSKTFEKQKAFLLNKAPGVWNGNANLKNQIFGENNANKIFNIEPVPGENHQDKMNYSSVGIEGGKGNFNEPLYIRIFSSGFANQVYHSYKWTQDTKAYRRNKAIRTTPGRVLVNEILQKLGDKE